MGRARHEAMLIRSLVLAGVIALPSLAAAAPITAGLHLGVSQTKEDGANGVDASDSVGLFGRLGFTKRVAGQLEVMKLGTEDGSGVTMRSGTLLVIADLTSSGRLVPTVALGVGVDRASLPYGSTDATHIEAGLGLEYRAEAGLNIGLDLRIGDRSLMSQTSVQPVLEGDVAYRAPSGLSGGEYRSARVTVGVRF